MGHEKLKFLAGLLIVMLFLTSCSNRSQPTDSSHNNIQNAKNVVEANDLFAFDLLNTIYSKNRNIFFSPFSVSSALSMVYEGAIGQTAREMRDVLHLPKGKDKVHEGYKKIFSSFNNDNIDVANAVWIENTYPFKASFFKTVKDFYNGKIGQVEFERDPVAAADVINEWVEKKTREKIKNIIPDNSLDPSTIMILTNAVYFKGNWSKRFNPIFTEKARFTTETGDSMMVTMMNQKNEFNFGETNDFKILEMKYAKGNLSMLIILPKKNNLNEIENEFSLEELNSLKKDMKKEYVYVSLPKFRFKTRYLLKKDLEKMGMPLAFEPTYAEFDGISEVGELHINQVIHQTYVEVAENGTEAAAATEVGIVATSAGPEASTPKPKRFIANHPFMFLIQDNNNDEILFLGILNKPEWD